MLTCVTNTYCSLLLSAMFFLVGFISSYVHVTRELFTVEFHYIFCISTMEPSICLYLPRWSTTTSTRQCFRPQSHGYRHEWPPRDLHPGLWHFWYCALLIQPIPLGPKCLRFLKTYLFVEGNFRLFWRKRGGKQKGMRWQQVFTNGWFLKAWVF